jgi:hypothetical protein
MLKFEITKQILYKMHIGSALLDLVSRDDFDQFRRILITLDSPHFSGLTPLRCLFVFTAIFVYTVFGLINYLIAVI